MILKIAYVVLSSLATISLAIVGPLTEQGSILYEAEGQLETSQSPSRLGLIIDPTKNYVVE